MTELTLEEKKQYVDRIDEKARSEGISIKYASAKLGHKVWAYYKYKTELRAVERGQRSAIDQSGSAAGKVDVEPSRVSAQITISLSDDVMSYLEQEAEGYATDAAIVAQLLLHDVVRQKIKSAGGKQ